MSAVEKKLQLLTREEVAKHNKEGDLWTIIDNKIFDLTRFVSLHPGGRAVLVDEEIAGQDATEMFFSLHAHEVLLRPNYARLQIGVIKDEQEKFKPHESGALSKVPYAEPTWLSEGFSSPYYKESHKRLREAFRKLVDDVIYPDAQACELNGKRPSQTVLDIMSKYNIHAMRLGPGKHLKGLTLMDGIVTPEEFDYFHELIITQELCRIGARGYGDALLAGAVIGLPPVLNFGSEELQRKVVPEIFQAKKFICLAISEAFAGSDVGGLRTTAVKSEDGKHWIINGTKKWITNGAFCDYFTVGCRTDGGFTVILVERSEGVETKPIKTSYSPTAGTAYITFDNVRVPIENTIGPEDAGLLVMLSNFNHERWVLCCSSARSQRLVVEQCITWAHQRMVFGRPLLEQAVVRSKIAAMISRVEAIQNWLENVTHQMNSMTYKQQSINLAGQIAFLKMYSTQSAQLLAQESTQIFGGRAITQTGLGRFIEHYHRTVPFDSLLGGAEDVLGDLGVRQMMRKIPENARL